MRADLTIDCVLDPERLVSWHAKADGTLRVSLHASPAAGGSNTLYTLFSRESGTLTVRRFDANGLTIGEKRTATMADIDQWFTPSLQAPAHEHESG